MEAYQYLQCPPRYSHCSGVMLQLSSLDEWSITGSVSHRECCMMRTRDPSGMLLVDLDGDEDWVNRKAYTCQGMELILLLYTIGALYTFCPFPTTPNKHAHNPSRCDRLNGT